MSTIIGHPTTVLPITRNLTSSPDIYPICELLGGVGWTRKTPAVRSLSPVPIPFFRAGIVLGRSWPWA
jgi:hypothetical protein